MKRHHLSFYLGHFKRKSFSGILLALAIFFSPLVYSYTPGKLYRLTILFTNDTHGHFWKNEKGEGGFAAQKTLVDRIREEVKAEGGHVLLLSAGDINTGTPASDLFDAEPDIIGMNHIGYDAMTLGNHEFDKDAKVLDKQSKWASFPFLSANIYKKKGTSSKRAFSSHLIKDYEGLKVGILGLTTADTPLVTNPKSTKNLIFKDVLEEAKEIVPSLREESDILIALTHIGFDPNGKNPPTNSPGDVTLASQIPGIDFILGGHTQVKVFPAHEIGKTRIMQAHEWGNYLGRIDMTFVDGKISMEGYDLIPINQRDPADSNKFLGEEIPEDPKLLEILRPYYEQVQEKMVQVVGEFDQDFYGRPAQLGKETNLGRLIAKAQAQALEGKIGIINNGGVRKNFSKGPVTYADLYALFPFDNSLCSVELTGKEIKEYLENITDVMHLYGMKVIRENGKIVKLKVGKQFIDLDSSDGPLGPKTYKMVMTDFVAKGGDAYPHLSDHPSFVETTIPLIDVIIEFIKSKGKINGDEFKKESFVDKNWH